MRHWIVFASFLCGLGLLVTVSGAQQTVNGTASLNLGTGTLAAATLDTGQGANELYDMDQNVLTTSTPTFSTVTATLMTTTGLVQSGLFVLGNTHPTVTVNGATTFAITSSFTTLACTGAETINTITGAGGTAGAILVLEHTDTECTIADDDAATATNAVNLTGSASDVGAAEKVIVLIHNGTSWYQVAESDN